MAEPVLKQFVQFVLVGGLGTVTNLVVFYLVVDKGGVAPLPGAVISFGISVSQNYVFNQMWTFQSGHAEGVSLKRYAKYVCFSLLALAVNLAVLQWLIDHYTFPVLVLPQSLGILAGTVLNHLASRWVTFR